MKKQRVRERVRDAGNGRFTTRADAELRPQNTVTETVHMTNRRQHGMATVTIENLTVSGDPDIHWGDSVRLHPSGMPTGKNYYSLAHGFYMEANQRKSANADATVDFVVGNGLPYQTAVPGDPSVTSEFIADSDANLSNGFEWLQWFACLPPR